MLQLFPAFGSVPVEHVIALLRPVSPKRSLVPQFAGSPNHHHLRRVNKFESAFFLRRVYHGDISASEPIFQKSHLGISKSVRLAERAEEKLGTELKEPVTAVIVGRGYHRNMPIDGTQTSEVLQSLRYVKDMLKCPVVQYYIELIS